MHKIYRKHGNVLKSVKYVQMYLVSKVHLNVLKSVKYNKIKCVLNVQQRIKANSVLEYQIESQ